MSFDINYIKLIIIIISKMNLFRTWTTSASLECDRKGRQSVDNELYTVRSDQSWATIESKKRPA